MLKLAHEVKPCIHRGNKSPEWQMALNTRIKIMKNCVNIERYILDRPSLWDAWQDTAAILDLFHFILQTVIYHYFSLHQSWHFPLKKYKSPAKLTPTNGIISTSMAFIRRNTLQSVTQLTNLTQVCSDIRNPIVQTLWKGYKGIDSL